MSDMRAVDVAVAAGVSSGTLCDLRIYNGHGFESYSSRIRSTHLLSMLQFSVPSVEAVSISSSPERVDVSCQWTLPRWLSRRKRVFPRVRHVLRCNWTLGRKEFRDSEAAAPVRVT
ncbi:unnamed protein product [Scytosiphon promiscuus]